MSSGVLTLTERVSIMDDSLKDQVLKRIRLTQTLEKKKKIPFLKGRPERHYENGELIINSEDIINLKIMLNVYIADQWEQFLLNS